MRKKIFVVLVVAVGVAFAGYNMMQSQNDGKTLSNLALANVEALATPEQPNIDDCKSDPNTTCVALHPTDPSQDKKKEHAKW